MASKKDNRIAWGVTLLVFGCLFLIRQLQILPPATENLIFDFRNYPLIMGIVFLLYSNNKTIGIVLVVVALLFRISDIIIWTRDISDYIWPVLLIVAGSILVFKRK